MTLTDSHDLKFWHMIKKKGYGHNKTRANANQIKHNHLQKATEDSCHQYGHNSKKSLGLQ